MPRDGAITRERILDVAQELILRQSYSGTTVDNIIDAVGVTKGAFFYHFKSKEDLARALIERFAARDAETYETVKNRAESLSDDPLQQTLLFVRLFEEMFEGLTEPYPGCLFASYLYELQQFGPDMQQLIENSFRKWRQLLQEKFQSVAERYPPRKPVDLVALADAFTVVLEGAFVTSKAMGDAGIVAAQLKQFRQYVELLFAPEYERVPAIRTAAGG